VDDVDALLDLADEQLAAIRETYDESLHEKQIPKLLPARIKNVLENQRSSLDYLATEIRSRYSGKSGIPYYPMAQQPSEFDPQFEAQLPGIALSHRSIRDTVERYQPYNQPWLLSLSKLTRENKHRRLTPQQRQERHMIRHESAAGVVEWDPSGVVFGPGVFIGGEPVNPATQRPLGAVDVIYVDWLFTETGESVIGLLTEIQLGVRAAVQETCFVAGL
jgi:hypothetical protein